MNFEILLGKIKLDSPYSETGNLFSNNRHISLSNKGNTRFINNKVLFRDIHKTLVVDSRDRDR